MYLDYLEDYYQTQAKQWAALQTASPLIDSFIYSVTAPFPLTALWRRHAQAF